MDAVMRFAKQRTSKHPYASCKKQVLGSGLLIGDVLPDIITYVDEAYYQSYCEHERPAYSAAKDVASSYQYLEIVADDWNRLLMRGGGFDRSFSYGVYPVVLSFTANFVITIFLTLLIFLNINGRRYKHTARLLKIGAIISSINIVIFVTRALKRLKAEHDRHGVTTVRAIMSLHDSDLTFSILDLISVFMIQLCQVMIVNRLFPRNLEKRIVILLGIPLVIVSNVLWAIPRFSANIRNSPRYWDTLPPFVFLFRIALSTSYACTITSHFFIKKKYCIRSLQIAILSILAILVVLLQPALFITDASDAWVWGVGELFNTTCYLGSAFIVWEWLERVDTIERHEQSQSFLGRPFYEDEQQDYRVASYALVAQKGLEQKSDKDTGEYHEIPYSSQDSPTSIHFHNGKQPAYFGEEVQFNQKPALKEVLKQVLDSTCRDLIHSLRRCKLWNGKTLSFKSRRRRDTAESRRAVRKRIGLDRHGEVYVYSTRDIVFDSDGE